MIYYQCEVCGCKFGISEADAKIAERNRVYITCPLDGRHDEMKMIKNLMEKREAISL